MDPVVVLAYKYDTVDKASGLPSPLKPLVARAARGKKSGLWSHPLMRDKAIAQRVEAILQGRASSRFTAKGHALEPAQQAADQKSFRAMVMTPSAWVKGLPTEGPNLRGKEPITPLMGKYEEKYFNIERDLTRRIGSLQGRAIGAARRGADARTENRALLRRRGFRVVGD